MIILINVECQCECVNVVYTVYHIYNAIEIVYEFRYSHSTNSKLRLNRVQ